MLICKFPSRAASFKTNLQMRRAQGKHQILAVLVVSSALLNIAICSNAEQPPVLNRPLAADFKGRFLGTFRQGNDVREAAPSAVNKTLLQKNPKAFRFMLPGNLTVTAIRRDDMAQILHLAQAYRDADPKAATGKHLSLARRPWIGDVRVEGRLLPGPLGSAILVIGPSGGVFGQVRFFHERYNLIRSFRMTPAVAQRPGDTRSTISTEHVLITEYLEENSLKTPGDHDGTHDDAYTTHKPVQYSEVQGDTPQGTPMVQVSMPNPQDVNVLFRQDMLVTYTMKAAASVVPKDAPNSTEWLWAQAVISWWKCNKAYQDSRIAVDTPINVWLNLVGFKQVNDSVTDDAGGSLLKTVQLTQERDDVQAWRKQLGADLVVIFSHTKDVLAAGTVIRRGNDTGQGFNADVAFAGLALGFYDDFSLAHEIGHLQGCSHNNDKWVGGNAGMATPYAAGLRRCDMYPNNFNTIMSYNCESERFDGAAWRGFNIMAFSSPYSTIQTRFNGQPGTELGNFGTAFCAQVISNSARAISEYMPEAPQGDTNTSATPVFSQPTTASRVRSRSSLPKQITTSATTLDKHLHQTLDDVKVVGEWAQCGGESCNGGTCTDQQWARCPKGWKCDRQNQYYHQCLPMVAAAVSGSGDRNSTWSMIVSRARTATARPMCLTAIIASDSSNQSSISNMLALECNGGRNQEWELHHDDSISLLGTSQCMTLVPQPDGTGRVVTADCKGDDVLQGWFYDRLGLLHSLAVPEVCIAIVPGVASKGGIVRAVRCQQTLESTFDTKFPVFSATYEEVRSGVGDLHGGMCLDAVQFNATVAKRAQLRSCLSGSGDLAPSQLWNNWLGSLCVSYGSGVKPIKVCLDASNATANTTQSSTMNPGSAVYVNVPSNKRSQLWFLDAVGRLRNFDAPRLCVAPAADAIVSYDAGGLLLEFVECDAAQVLKWFVAKKQSGTWHH